MAPKPMEVASSTELRLAGTALCVMAIIIQVAGMIVDSNIHSNFVGGPFNVQVDAGLSNVRIQSFNQVAGPNGTVALPKIDTTANMLSQDCTAAMSIQAALPFSDLPCRHKGMPLR